MESCVFSNIGWLNKDTSLNTAKFASIPGVADKVTQCLSAAPAVTRSTEWQGGGRRRKKQDKNRRGRSKKQGKGRSARRGGGRGAKGKLGKKKERREKRKGGKGTGRRGQGRGRNARETESSSLDVPDIAMLRPEQVSQRETKRMGRKKKEDSVRKEQRKKEKEEKKILKSISLEKFPSEETIDQLWCIRYDNNI